MRAAMARAGIPQYALNCYGAATSCTAISPATRAGLPKAMGGSLAVDVPEAGGPGCLEALSPNMGSSGSAVIWFWARTPVRQATHGPDARLAEATRAADHEILQLQATQYPELTRALRRRLGIADAYPLAFPLSALAIADLAAAQRLQSRGVQLCVDSARLSRDAGGRRGEEAAAVMTDVALFDGAAARICDDPGF